MSLRTAVAGRRLGRSIVLGLLAVALGATAQSIATRPLAAAEQYGNALDLVPADAAFFNTSLRLREQFEIVANSNAWEKLRTMPAVQMMWQQAFAQGDPSGGGLDMVRQIMQLPENQEALALLADMFSHEVFLYGNAEFIDSIQLWSEVQAASQAASVAALTNQEQPDENAQARASLDILSNNLDKLRVPELVWGFKITDAQRANTQLRRLEILVGMGLQQAQPDLMQRLERTKVGDDEFITFTLDGSMIPWDKAEFEKFEQRPGQYDALKARLQAMTLVISLGVRGDYLLLSIADSTEHLTQLGQGPTLASVRHLQPLARFAGKPLVGVSYASQAMLEQLGTGKQDIDQVLDLVRAGLPHSELPADLQQRILRDATQLADDFKTVIPKPGAMLSFSMLTPRGYESYSYNWTENLSADGSKPLDLLQHVGGAPLLAVVGRTRYSPEQYQTLVKYIKLAYGYVEEFAVPQMEPDDREKFEQAMTAARPLLARLDRATATMLLPALADGQSGLVLDAKIASRKWFRDMPAAARPLPMLEPALIFGVSDAALLRQAMTEYKSIADAAVDKLREMHPGEVPADFRLPEPQARETASGTVYVYPLPAEAGVDAQLAPNGGLGTTVAVLSFSPQQTERLLAENKPASTGLLADTARPLAGAGYFNWAGTVDALMPWVEYGIYQATADADFEAEAAGQVKLDLPEGRTELQAEGAAELRIELDEPNEQAQFILDNVRIVADVLKCLRTVESVTWLEDGATVTHTQTHFRDVE